MKEREREKERDDASLTFRRLYIEIYIETCGGGLAYCLLGLLGLLRLLLHERHRGFFDQIVITPLYVLIPSSPIDKVSRVIRITRVLRVILPRALQRLVASLNSAS